jgi:hypothetical protein
MKKKLYIYVKYFRSKAPDSRQPAWFASPQNLELDPRLLEHGVDHQLKYEGASYPMKEIFLFLMSTSSLPKIAAPVGYLWWSKPLHCQNFRF